MYITRDDKDVNIDIDTAFYDLFCIDICILFRDSWSLVNYHITLCGLGWKILLNQFLV